ncbi:hypothetical protein DFO72_102325 [Cytobacillus oceanisediminis]|uniref:Uncharacterized protein n=1 Tax=Cytobacillus oceanisediminis TaxID=665099 RepID=A0A4V3GWY9_9BACI|nr:hypothetical protein DFO72_102325 [Cytobacillus oceanisediminis]
MKPAGLLPAGLLHYLEIEVIRVRTYSSIFI